MSFVSFPIRLTRNGYRGTNASKRRKADADNQTILVLERHINALLEAQTQPIAAYLYFEIAWDTGVDLKTVERLCVCLTGGSNGFTAHRKDLTLKEALEQHDRLAGLH